MQYFGGKARIAKPLAEYLNSQLKEGQPFVDLFCGSCNVISKIDSNRTRITNDLHKELIAMWKHVQEGGELPDNISKAEYETIRDLGEPWLRGFVGFGCSFAGKFFGGYARGGEDRNYCSNAKNSTLKKMESLEDVVFLNQNYKDVVIPEGSMLYCDIPYKDSTQYSVGSFNHQEFYKWAEDKSQEGFTVLVSEYKENVPDGWEVVWECSSKKDIRDSEGVQKQTVEVLMKPKDK
jgi:DNA adenine methylase